MSLFTKEELEELAAFFNLKMAEDRLPVRDGYVTKGQMVWWRCNEGPEHVRASHHWDNIQAYPTAYQISEPKVKPSNFSGYAD